MARHNKPELSKALQISKSALYFTLLTIPVVEHLATFTIPQIRSIVESHVHPKDIEQSNEIWAPDRRRIEYVFDDLVEIGVLSCARRTCVNRFCIDRYGEQKAVAEKIGGKGFPYKAKEVFWLSRYPNTAYYLQCAWLALAFEYRNNVSTFDFLGRFDRANNADENDGNLGLGLWVNIIYDMSWNEKPVEVVPLADKYDINDSTLGRRLKVLEALGHMAAVNIGRSREYVPTASFMPWLEASNSAIAAALSKYLKNDSRAIDTISVHKLRNILDGQFSIKDIRYFVRRLRRNRHITPNPSVPYQGSTGSYNLFMVKYTTSLFADEFILPIINEYGRIRNPVISHMGIGEFIGKEGIDADKYWDAVSNSLSLYRSSNPHFKRNPTTSHTSRFA